ncbi:hypothetical protein T4A_14483 [Trichinella pseudospiralis]|uniref:Uncharacterized protein n=1 Tax=Trichinella pseudospiralis TaxID=6337 RepID=A0A0V1E3T1_TRIPS|nr:hypothetical protein T4A_14483 [Trichinella pseudospiralis]KRY89251.1 hypothetical protein T4D_9780 [Trichinella pseudospiralis]
MTALSSESFKQPSLSYISFQILQSNIKQDENGMQHLNMLIRSINPRELANDVARHVAQEAMDKKLDNCFKATGTSP